VLPVAKVRIPIPDDVASLVLFNSDRTCCVCRRDGLVVQLHHIDEDPSNNAPENLAALCFQCHDDTQIKGGFGRKLDSHQVLRYRDDWHNSVQAQRETIAQRAGLRMVLGVAGMITSPGLPDTPPDIATLRVYFNALPAMVKAAYGNSRQLWNTGVTSKMRQGNYDLIHLLQLVLSTLARWFPPGHFCEGDPQLYFGAVTASRFTWHRSVFEVGGHGTGGTIVGIHAGGQVIADLETMVQDMVCFFSLNLGVDGFDYKKWKEDWEAASALIIASPDERA
jgi:hypothetical protein